MIYLAYHDVCLNNFQKVQQDLQAVRELLPEVNPALMVVANPHSELLKRPNFAASTQPEFKVETSGQVKVSGVQEREELAQLQGFRKFLDKQRQLGSRIFQHGLTHYVDEKYKRSLIGFLVNKQVGQEAEFAGLNREDCEELFELVGLAWDSLELGESDGFVAPTWHAPGTLEEHVQNSPLRFYESRSQIVDFETKTTLNTPSLSFWGETVKQYESSLAWNRRYYRFNRILHKDLKLALHPSDFQSDRIEQTMDFIKNLAPSENFTSYP